MAATASKSTPGKKPTLAEWLTDVIGKRKLRQATIAKDGGMSKSKVSRLCNGKNCVVTEQDINRLALALKLSPADRDALRYIAWPELRYIDDALRDGKNCMELDILLEQNNLPAYNSTTIE